MEMKPDPRNYALFLWGRGVQSSSNKSLKIDAPVGGLWIHDSLQVRV